MMAHELQVISAIVQANKSTFFRKKPQAHLSVIRRASCLSELFDRASIQFAQSQALYWARAFAFPTIPLHRGLPTLLDELGRHEQFLDAPFFTFKISMLIL